MDDELSKSDRRSFRQNRVRALYDEDYVSSYEERFLMAPWPKAGADFEASVLRRILSPGSRWLDVGCGTGYFLSLFPGVARAGIDLSPAMVRRARAANPDALFIDEHDFLEDVPDWHGEWSVVSCIWQPYHYVQSIWEVEQLVENMVRWTAVGGSCFIPIIDLEDVRQTVLPYEDEPGVWGGTIALTGITWTWHDVTSGKRHEHSVAPHVEHFVRLLESAFNRVEILRYPPLHPGWVSRKAVLATRRRAPGETELAEVIRHASPESTSAQAPESSPPADAAVLPTGALARELARRARPSDGRLWEALARAASRRLHGAIKLRRGSDVP